MLGTNKNTEKFILNMSSYIGGVLQQSFDLTKSKLLIGSFEGADICIQNDQTSYYHALIVIDSNGEGDIRDLSSKNGIFINGEKTDSGHFSSGDVIAIGSVEFHITERPSSSEVINTDQNVKSIIIEMTSAPNELPPKDGLTLIDGEYCDISFDERNFSGENLEEINSVDLSIENYVDLDESIVEEHKNIILNDMSDSVEVTILSNGTIIDLHHLPVKNRTYYASGNHIERRNTVTIPGLETDKKVQFISIKDGKIIIHDIDRFFKVDSGVSAVCSSSELLKGDIQTFTYGINQIILRVTKSPAKLKVSPFFYQDKEMLKQAGKVFGVAISLMLLLLLVDTTPERPEPKKLSIIYKKAVNASTHSDKKTST
ncbi:MAG: FHA domain-containing protein, partial [Bacteriovoracaceae bacterium]|nr:FHA domain-containing protein [Bacteriovoracaceae bacterium]